WVRIRALPSCAWRSPSPERCGPGNNERVHSHDQDSFGPRWDPACKPKTRFPPCTDAESPLRTEGPPDASRRALSPRGLRPRAASASGDRVLDVLEARDFSPRTSVGRWRRADMRLHMGRFKTLIHRFDDLWAEALFDDLVDKLEAGGKPLLELEI